VVVEATAETKEKMRWSGCAALIGLSLPPPQRVAVEMFDGNFFVFLLVNGSTTLSINAGLWCQPSNYQHHV